MKKFFLVLGLMFVLLSFVKVASAATLTLSPSSGSYTAGQIFTVDVNLDTAGQAIDGLDLYFLRYNSSILEVQDSNSSIFGIQIKAGALMAQTLTNTVDPANGKITFSQVTSSGTTYNGSGKLATISFKAIANGTSAVAFDFTLGSTSDTNVAGGGTDKLTSVSNASFSVTGGSAPLPPPPPSPPSPNLTGGDITPPAEPTNFKAQGADKQITLTWQNPKDSDFVRVLIMKNPNNAPVSITDGQIIYEGDKQEYTDTNLDNTKTYHYSIFAYDKKPNYTQALTLQAKPEAGKIPIDIKPPETDSQKVIAEEKKLISKLDNNLAKKMSGRILLQVEKNGQAWYVYPNDQKKYYLGKPADAFKVMRKLGLGIKQKQLDNYLKTKFPSQLSGRILLDVEKQGQAYYINPKNLQAYYLSRPAKAFSIMRELGLGITNANIRKIGVGEIR